MRRACSLIGLVILLTAGIWYYLPPVEHATCVFYQLAPDASGQCSLAVMRTDHGWQLALECVELRQASRLSPLLPEQRSFTAILLLNNPSDATVGHPDQLQLLLTDDQGRQFVANGEATAPSAVGTGWRYRLCVPRIPSDISTVRLTVSSEQATFCFGPLVLP